LEPNISAVEGSAQPAESIVILVSSFSALAADTSLSR